MLIGLTGPAFAGKDSVAEHLRLHRGFRVESLANPIREGLKAMFVLSDWHFQPAHKETVIDWIGKSPRQLMQSLGTEWGRDLVARDIWLKRLELRLGNLRRLKDSRVVISDIRMVNEAAMINHLGGQLWRIVRPGQRTTPHADHTTEQEQHRLVPDLTIVNDGTLADLYQQVDEALANLITTIEARTKPRRLA